MFISAGQFGHWVSGWWQRGPLLTSLFSVICVVGGVRASTNSCLDFASLLPQETRFVVTSSSFRANRDFFLAAKAMPVEFLRDLSRLHSQDQLFDAGCGIARLGSELSLLQYVRTETVPRLATYKDYHLPEVFVRDVGKSIGSGGGRCHGIFH